MRIRVKNLSQRFGIPKNEYSNKLCIGPLRGRLQAAAFRFVVSGIVSYRSGSSDRLFCEKVNLFSTKADTPNYRYSASCFLPAP
jgi:hypothetical protein